MQLPICLTQQQTEETNTMTNILLSYQSTHGHLYSPASCSKTGNSDSFFQTLAKREVDGEKKLG